MDVSVGAEVGQTWWMWISPQTLKGAVEPFEAGDQRGRPSAATIEKITGPWNRLWLNNTEIG